MQSVKTIVFAVATAQEKYACSSIVRMAGDHSPERPVFLQTGGGPLDVERLAQQIVRLRASALVSIGTAGGLAPGIAPGTLLIPKKIRTTGGRILQTDSSWQAEVFAAMTPVVSVDEGDLVSVSQLVRRPGDKRALFDETRAVGVDMESGDLAEAADRVGIRFLAVRAVMDALHDEIPGAAQAAVAANGDTAVFALLACLVKHPGDFIGMLRMVDRFRCAARTLRTVSQSGDDALLRSR